MGSRKGMGVHRRRVTKHITKLGERPQPLRMELASHLPKGSPTAKLHLPLISLLASALNYPDTNIARVLLPGMDIAGGIPNSNALATRTTTASVGRSEITTNIRGQTRQILRYATSVKDQALKTKRWDISWTGREKGWMSKPTHAMKSDRTTKVSPPRFCISGRHGNHERKFRLIDDLSRSLANQTVDMADTYCPQDIDPFVAMVRFLPHEGASNLRMCSADCPNAYKTIDLHKAAKEAAHICFVNPATNTPHTAEILVHPFRSRRAPGN